MSITFRGAVPRTPLSMADADVVELRQYTLRPGRRDELIDVFEEHLVESQEAAGMRVGGLFLDRDDPDRFVWMRGFTDMESRRRALEDFYGGQVWAQHADTANPTMLDVDNVLLLRPTEPPQPAGMPAERRRPTGSAAPDEWVAATTYVLPGDQDMAAMERWIATDVHAELAQRLHTPGRDVAHRAGCEHVFGPAGPPRAGGHVGSDVLGSGGVRGGDASARPVEPMASRDRPGASTAYLRGRTAPARTDSPFAASGRPRRPTR